MIKKLFFNVLVFSIINLFFVQVNGQSISNYTFSASSGAYTTLSGGAAIDVIEVDEAISGAIPLGFTFVYMGNAYTQVYASSNGFVSFNSLASATFTNNLSTSDAKVRPLLAPLWDDLDGASGSGAASYATTGAAGSRVFILEWLNWQWNYSATGATISFQLKLYEADGKIEFVYRQESGTVNSGSASIGITATATGSGNYLSLDGTGSSPIVSSAVETTTLSSKPATGQIYVFTPPAAPTTPSNLTFSAVSGTGMTLNWTDNATTETGYVIMRSTDGVNYTSIATIAANSTSYGATGLNFGTTYYWKVLAVNEGRSSEVSGSQATSAGTICGNKTIGPTGDYASLTAAFADINANGLGCNVNLILQSTYVSTVETFPVAGPNSAPMGTYTATIFPSVTGLSITSANTTGTINLNGSRNVIIDGRVNASGSAQDLIIENTSASGYAINFINDANNNRIKYCNIKGVNTSATSGVVVFSTTTGSNGNDNNTIEYCNLTKGATKPKCLVYSEGTASKQNSGNDIRYNNFFDYDASLASAGIYLYSHTEDWNIIGNSFYQTTAYAGTTNTTIYCINISSNGNGFSITDNYLGGSASNCGGSPWTINGTATTYRFIGMKLSLGTVNISSVQNNTISNFDWKTTIGGVAVFTGIELASGNANIGSAAGNIIGSVSSTENIKINSTNWGYTYGIYSSSTGSVVVSNNIICGLYGYSTTVGQHHTIKGINVSGSSGNYIINNNTIGSTTLSNSIKILTSGFTTANGYFTGIENSATGNVAISNNLIANIVNYGNNTLGTTFGISSTNGTVTISNNTIRDISSSSSCSTTGSSTPTIGIRNNGSITANIYQNTIYNITNNHTTVIGPCLTGIQTHSNSSIYRNNIYNLVLSTTANGWIRGLEVTNGTSSIFNNMICIGNGLTNSYEIIGISDLLGTNNFYFNSVYINCNVSGVNHTYAFKSSDTTNTRSFRNNIFYNACSNAGTGKNYAIQLAGSGANPTGLTCDYNIYYYTGTNGVLGFFNLADRTTLQAWRYATGQDLHSTIADPKYANPTATTPNLHIQAGVATPVEGSGIAISAITDDFDGDIISSNTPTDIGADAGNFTSLDDKFTPNITYTALTNGSGTCSSSRTFEATITDVGTGVPTSGGNMPRVWFKKNAGAWFSAAGTLSSGNGNNGIWSFVIDYTTLGGVATSDVIYYYIVAQDQAATPNIWYTAFEAAAPAHSNVNTQTTPPAAPNSYTIVPSLSGTINVGSGQTYTTLTAAGGLFAAINAGVVTGNIVANITSDITETGANSLNQWNEGCGAAFTLTIQPDGTTVRTISGATSNPTSMIKINRADRVTINGVNKYLVFANNGSGAAIEIGDGSKYIVINQCNISANNTANGVVFISPHSVANDGPEVTITNNYIHNYTSGSNNSLIYINSNYSGPTVISNNYLFDFKTSAIYINSHGTRKYTISGNHIYNTVNTSTGNYSGMYLVSGDSIEVTGNYIGGQAANCGGSAWSNTDNRDFYGIRVMNSATTMKFCEVKNNTIKNITQSNNSDFYGIQIDNTYVLSSLVEGNTISDIATTYTGTKYLRGIQIKKGANVRNNKVYNLNGIAGSNNSWIMGIDFDNTSVDVNNEISNNMICLDGGGRDHIIYGIRSNTRTSSILRTYYNSVYLKGSITVSATNNTAAFYRNIASNENCRNNIFINTRTGTANNFAIRTNSSSLANHISTYNLLISVASNQVGHDGSAKDFATWRSNGKDQSTWCALASVGSTDYANLNPADLFVDASNGDLSINTANAAAWYVFGKGVAGELSNNVATDYFSNARTTSPGMATCIGAHEFAQPAVAPISANASGAPAAGTTTTYTFGNRTICSIDWAAGSNVPASVDVKYYSGVNPQNPNPGDAQYHNAFVRVTATGGTEPFNYTMNLYYDTAFRGTVTKNTDTRLSKYNTFWTTYNETTATQSAGAVYYISKSGLTNFSDFTCSDMDHVLPVELLVFKAFAEDAKVKLYWSTASETNNQYFEIEHSADAQDWQAITQVEGNGNSNRVLNYAAVDNNPLDGINYYRLKQVDFDGQYSYSDVVAINLASSQNSAQEKWNITLFPNPVADVLRIKAEQVEADNLWIRIFTVSGTLVKTEAWQTNGNELLVKEMMLQDLQPGLYFVEFFDGKQSQTLRMVKK